MPNNTQDGYANAFLGNFNSYNEGGRVVGNYWYTDIEAFIQDNWRVSRRVTIDAGVRFYHQLPTAESGSQHHRMGSLVLQSGAGHALYYPGCTVSTAARACPTANQIADRSRHRVHHILRPQRYPRAGFGRRLLRYTRLPDPGHGTGRRPEPQASAVTVERGSR